MLNLLSLPDDRKHQVMQLMLSLGADKNFRAYRNLVPVMLRLVCLADATGLTLGYQSSQCQAIQDFVEAIERLPPTLLPWVYRSATSASNKTRGNPLSGNIGQHPLLAALLEPVRPGQVSTYTMTLLAGLAMSAPMPNAHTGLRKVAKELRLAAIPNQERECTLRAWYIAPERGVRAVRALHNRVARICQLKPDHANEPSHMSCPAEATVSVSPGSDNVQLQLAKALRYLTALYLEQWATHKLVVTDIPAAHFHMWPYSEEPVAEEVSAYIWSPASPPEAADPSTAEDEPPRLVQLESISSGPFGRFSDAGFAAAARRSAIRYRFQGRPGLWNPERLNEYERLRVIAHLFRQQQNPNISLDPPATLVAALVLATGTPLDHCLAMKLGPDGDLTSTGIYRRHVPHAHPLASEPAPSPPADRLSLSLPAVVQQLLQAVISSPDQHGSLETLLGSGPVLDWEKRITALLTPLLPGGKRRATPARLRETFRAILMNVRRDLVCLYALTSRENDPPPIGAQYASIDGDSLCELYAAVTRRVFATHGAWDDA